MRHAPWWVSAFAAFAATMGCDSNTNPNEVDFPGAPGSRVPAPTPDATKGAGVGSRMGMGDGGGLPSTYPGINDRGGASKEAKKADAVKPAEEPKKEAAPAPK